jgi:hypothetical protein
MPKLLSRPLPFSFKKKILNVCLSGVAGSSALANLTQVIMHAQLNSTIRKLSVA